MKITQDLLSAALETIGDDIEIAQMVGLKPYWGGDRTSSTGHRVKPRRTLREPIIVSKEEYDRETELLNKTLFKGFNRDIVLGPTN